MDITEHLISPNYHRKTDFISGELVSDFSWKCKGCNSTVCITFKMAADAYSKNSIVLSEDEYSELKKICGIGYVGKSHDGGWPHFIDTNCKKCEQRYMIYLGINELNNSCLHITIQAVSLWNRPTIIH